jgi:quercetin dioxygenase-like cupin family protein
MMPVILQADETKVIRQGDGWQEIALADTNTFGAEAMIARRWVLESGARGPELVHGQADQLLYVIRGEGTAVVDNQPFPLTEESILWLEPGEIYQFVAGEAGLDILQGYAVFEVNR